jgi:AraC-like DNA-binding protein
LLLSARWVEELVERVNLADDVPSALKAIYGLLGQLAGKSRPPRESIARRALEVRELPAHAEPGAVGALAKHIDVSPRHLNREFHRYFGMGPRRYSIIRRLQTAMAVLSAGALENLTALAVDLGFYDYSHFSHEFARFVLTTPAQFHESQRHREYQVVAGEPRAVGQD